MASAKQNQEKEKQSKPTGLLARVGELLTGDRESAADQDEKATTMLEEDHARVRELFKRYDALGERARVEKGKIAAEVCAELSVHAEIEEQIFYPACMKGKKDEVKMVRESIEEHGVVKSLIAQIERLSPDNEQYDAKVTVLRENVEHHVKEEEHDLFPQAEDQMGDDQLRRLGAQMKSLKEKLQAKARGGKSSGPGKAKGATSSPRAKSSASGARRGNAKSK